MVDKKEITISCNGEEFPVNTCSANFFSYLELLYTLVIVAIGYEIVIEIDMIVSIIIHPNQEKKLHEYIMFFVFFIQILCFVAACVFRKNVKDAYEEIKFRIFFNSIPHGTIL